MNNLKDIYKKQQEQKQKSYNKKQKTNSVLTIGLLLIVIAVVAFLVITIFKNKISNQTLYIDDSFKPYTTINVIDHNEVTIYGSDVNEMTINYRDNKNNNYQITVSDEMINIINTTGKVTGGLTITVPYNQVLNIQGQITGNDFYLEYLDVKNINVVVNDGDIKISNIYTEDQVTIVADEIMIEKCDLKNTINKVVANDDIYISDVLTNGLDVQSQDGDIAVTLYYNGKETTNPYDVTANANHGYVEQDINNDDNKNVKIIVNAIDGNISIGFLDN